MLKRVIFLIHNFLKKAPFLRKFILIILDILLIQISLSLTFYFFLPIEANESRVFSNYLIGFSFQFSFLFLSAAIYLLTDQYKSLTRYIDSYSFYKIGIRNIFVTVLLALISNYFNLSNISNRALLIFWLILTSMESVLRIVLKDFLSFSKNTNKLNNYTKKVAIYGAGEAGTQLYSILKLPDLEKLKFLLMMINHYPLEK